MPGLASGTASSLSGRAPWVSRARLRAEGTTEVSSPLALAEQSVEVPPRVIAPEAQGSQPPVGHLPGTAATPSPMRLLESQMEGTVQPSCGQDSTSVELAAGAALCRARDVLMTPGATRDTFAMTTPVTTASARHVHWRDAVDSGDGWFCTNCLELARASRCEACGASRHELAVYAPPGELASLYIAWKRSSASGPLKLFGEI